MVLTLLFNLALLAIGSGLLLKGAEWVTDSAAHVARRFGTTSVAVGLILVSAMLSLPEIVVAGAAMFKGHPQIGLGALLGSVIINIGLIVGVCSMIKPLRVSRVMLLRDLVFMMVATIIVVAMALNDGKLDRVDGTVFLLLFVPYLINVYQQEKVLGKKEAQKEGKQIVNTLELVGKIGIGELKQHYGIGAFLIGGIALIVGGTLLTDALIFISGTFGISDLIIGVTLGALGPSLPNLAAAVQATRRGYEELAISETIGSNIFTLLVSVGLFAVLAPMTLAPSSRMVTLPALLIITFLFMGFTIKGTVTKREGAVLLAAYAVAVGAELVYAVAH
ncbi:sodium:calcium antiporter [Candidatus Micrarchaeota archaeon]|nr:sodium:calcium antiporter [Candidatus Micrarchaeota archaeon]